jgi:hypothetical protein
MIEPIVSQNYPCQARVIKVHKSAIKDSLGPHLVENPYFSGCLPPDLGMKSAF